MDMWLMTGNPSGNRMRYNARSVRIRKLQRQAMAEASAAFCQETTTDLGHAWSRMGQVCPWAQPVLQVTMETF